MRQLAHDDDIAVAGPVLTQSPRLQETELVELAKTKGQAHLAVIAGREGHRRGRHRRAGPPRRHRGDAQRRRQSIRQAVGGRLLGAGQARRRRRRSGREGRPAAGHPGASVPRSSGARDRGGAAAPVAGGQARNAKRDPARAREGLQGIRQQHAGARLRGRAARGRSRCTRPAASASPSLPNSPRTRNSRRPWRRCRCCAACRSRPRTG